MKRSEENGTRRGHPHRIGERQAEAALQGLERLLARLEGEGVTIEVPYQEQSGLGVKRAVIVDPVGTRIELTEGLARR